MKYYTISMFSKDTLLESITTKVAVDSMPDKTIKLLMESYEADEAWLFESNGYGHYERNQMDNDPIRKIKL